MPQPLYIADLDGTLLRSDATLSAFSRDTLNRLMDQDADFTVATARSVVSAAVILKGLNLRLPIIEFNGAFLSDLHTGRHEAVNAIAPARVEEMFGLIAGAGCHPIVSTFDGRRDRVYYREAVNGGMRWYVEDRRKHQDQRWAQADDLACALADEVVCLTVIDEAERLVELERAVLEHHGEAVVTHLIENLYSRPWHWLTIHDRRATKDQAICLLAERYGLADREAVVFGDQANDVAMFKAAHRAVAVANADPLLKRHAAAEIGPNDEDSVATYIAQDWGQRRVAGSDACSTFGAGVNKSMHLPAGSPVPP